MPISLTDILMTIDTRDIQSIVIKKERGFWSAKVAFTNSFVVVESEKLVDACSKAFRASNVSPT